MALDPIIEARVEKAARDAARRTAIRAATGYFVLLLVAIIGLTFFQRHTNTIVKEAAAATCKRVNTLRIEESNRNAQVVWAALYRSEQRETQLANGTVDSKLHRTSADYLRRSANLMRWTPMTNCAEAVKHPDSYRPPTPRGFNPGFLDFRVIPK